MPGSDGARGGAWWRSAAIYEIYIRSFADGNGDGVGDIAGIRSRLPYLAGLGVDAIWITPWYPSPMADGGYDITDHRGIDPLFGDLAEAEALIGEAHAHGLRVIADLVPNHTSHRHPWFRAAVAAGPGSPERGRYWFRPGRGLHGELPPNDWTSVFGGPAWTRLPETGEDDAPEWYLHLFAPEQPDLNWTSPDVAGAFDAIIRFWFDRGVDGLRVDVAHGLAKDPDLRDLGPAASGPRAGAAEAAGHDVAGHPHWDRDENAAIFERWRAIADSYAGTPAGPRTFVAEAWRVRENGLARYLRPGRLHTAFNFDFLTCPWDPAALRRAIDGHLAGLAEVGAAATWVLSSHDLVRPVTRYGLNGAWTDLMLGEYDGTADVRLGTRRARAAALLTLALPGAVYVYQGDELGLPEADVPGHARRDPIWERSRGRRRGRDGCRVPLPWDGTPPALGFGAREPWLPQPAGWSALAADRQDRDPESTLTLYRRALRLRRTAAGPEDPLRWRDTPEGLLAFDRGGSFTCAVNLTGGPVPLPGGGEPILASAPLTGGTLPPDTAVWLHAPQDAGGR
ncbi:alpha-amylase family glycosyl hydrolase [Actinomadura viridis]|uniref:alpha-amylase family glycosyl hydrolase n=1 Tax=Actinomadura viridis TaxID=58110 RepID=UPI0036C5E3F4